jgi:hypothetical protein
MCIRDRVQRGLGIATRYRWSKTARETLAVYDRVVGKVMA